VKAELRGLPRFSWQGWNQAANALATQKVHLDEATAWVDRSIGMQKNFANAQTKARILTAQGNEAAAEKLIDESIVGATEAELNAYGYQLLGAGKNAEAIAVFRDVVRKHPDSWNARDSLGEGLATAGQNAEAVRSYEQALAKAPADQKARIEGILGGLRKKL
jgi:Flp pilus assembly protein TadD